MNVVFVNYGFFGNNSSYHIEGFAVRLAQRGHRVAIVADRSPEVEIPGVFTGSFDEVARGEISSELAKLLRDPATLLHGWTPREPVRRLIQPLADAGHPYVIHLEDNERLVTASQLGVAPGRLEHVVDASTSDFPAHLSHPRLSVNFVAGATGLTVISPALATTYGEVKAVHVLEPGVDLSVFGPKLRSEERRARRAALACGDSTTVIVYPGNVHQAVQRDIFSLYSAVALLRKRGFDVVLVRTGMSECVTRVSTRYRMAEGVIHLGCVPRDEVPKLLDIADLYIQPGWLSPFNADRIPSKLLEFLAMGRPVITPKVNLGRRLTNGENAIILQQGGAEALAEGVQTLIKRPEIGKALGLAGRRFVERCFDWDSKVDGLERFYGRVMERSSAGSDELQRIDAEFLSV